MGFNIFLLPWEYSRDDVTQDKAEIWSSELAEIFTEGKGCLMMDFGKYLFYVWVAGCYDDIITLHFLCPT